MFVNTFSFVLLNLSVTCDRSMVLPGYFCFLCHDSSDRHDIADILLKVALNTISHYFVLYQYFYIVDQGTECQSVW